MKNLIIYFAFAALVFSCQKKETAEQNKQENLIVIGQVDSLHSEILNEQRKLLVYVPESAKGNSNNQEKYPVLYLLDGDDHFHSVTGMVHQLSAEGGNNLIPEMIVVGIPNTDRTRDLTPTHVPVVFGDSAFVRTSGGGEKFLDFMEKELIPFIERKYPASTYRTFVGHSFGGLAVINTLLKRPQLFSNYVAIDPSLWWDSRILLETADSVIAESSLDGKALFVGVANTMERNMNIGEVNSDTTETTEHIRSILQFVDNVERKKSKMHFGWKYYRDDDHGSVPLITEYDALRFLFPWYGLSDLDDLFNADSTATTEELLDTINSHYKNVSHHFGYEVLPPEGFINALGYDFLTTKPDLAFSMFNLNIQNFPNSSNVFDSMGDYYLAQADTLNAIESFAKAVEIDGFEISKEKLENLKKEYDKE